MKVRVYRNLDRPFSILGIKGKFIAVAGAMLLLCVIVAVLIGSFAGTFAGLAGFAVLLVIGYLLVSWLQDEFGGVMMERKLGSLGMPKFVIVNSKVWKR